MRPRIDVVGFVAIVSAAAMIGCSPDLNSPTEMSDTSPSIRTRLTKNARGDVVPERPTPANSVRDKEFLYWTAMANGGLVRVGMKDSAASRGIWHGEILVSDDQRMSILKRLADQRDVEIVDRDALLPALKVKVHSRAALASLSNDPNVDYVVPVVVPDGEFAVHDGCAAAPWTNASTLTTVFGGDTISGPFRELFVDRAWSYATGALVSLGWADTGIDTGGSWGEVNAMAGRLTTLLPNSGGCTHGTRMILTAAGPANGSGSIGVAYNASVISSDVGGTVVPSGGNAYDAVHRLFLAGGMPSGSILIAFGFGLTGVYPDLDDLIDLGYYSRGFAFFSPAGSASSSLPVVFPASKTEVFAVTARLSLSTPHPNAHTGAAVDGVAFVPVFVSGIGGAAKQLDITSGATAQVAGVAALVLQKFPSYTNANLYARLKNTAREYCGPANGGIVGIINAEAAVNGLCIPPGQFSEVSYTFYPGAPITATIGFCLSYSGGGHASSVVYWPTPNPSNPNCGSVTFGYPTPPYGTISIPAYVWDDLAPGNPPILNYFRIKVNVFTCPPETPNCI